MQFTLTYDELQPKDFAGKSIYPGDRCYLVDNDRKLKRIIINKIADNGNVWLFFEGNLKTPYVMPSSSFKDRVIKIQE